MPSAFNVGAFAKRSLECLIVEDNVVCFVARFVEFGQILADGGAVVCQVGDVKGVADENLVEVVFGAAS